ncbi:hypothetical protein BGP_0477 [Beggiatoa sp. PS]|nr:hypothetical protein BGP_0477 [Beggiatoa sp. PS]
MLLPGIFRKSTFPIPFPIPDFYQSFKFDLGKIWPILFFCAILFSFFNTNSEHFSPKSSYYFGINLK